MTDKEESMPMRDKYWTEIDTEKKIERMREIVHSLIDDVNSLEETVKKLRVHCHTDSGEITVPFDPHRTAPGIIGRLGGRRSDNGDEVYF